VEYAKIQLFFSSGDGASPAPLVTFGIDPLYY
jgi:hypothetical protein